MSELRELYQEMILDHNRKPRNFRVMDNATQKPEGYNPLCGDRLTIFLKIENDVIDDVSFQGSGCAISKSSASMMTARIKGRTVKEAESIFQAFHAMLAEEGKEMDSEKLGKLSVFSGVNEFPLRVKCATLAWHTMRSGLNGKSDTSVSTE
jgi:nitrogen fixation protein NifU and related proteins